jgi:hypothetical protein
VGLLLIGFVFVTGIVVAAVASKSKIKLARPDFTEAGSARAGAAITGKALKRGDATYVGPAQDVSVAEGWRPVYIKLAESELLEWGACFYQWHKDLAQTFGDTNAKKRIIAAVGKVMDWVLVQANPLISFIVKRVCFRLEIPSLKIRLEDGLELFAPMLPSGVPRTGYDSNGAFVINGWNPGSTRVGFPARFGEWPLEWPPPEGMVSAGWIRNLGDIAGVGSDVYQVITNSYGEERSWPMMTKTGWRSMFRVGGDFAFIGGEDRRPALEMFDEWRGGMAPLRRRSATKVKAENRYK